MVLQLPQVHPSFSFPLKFPLSACQARTDETRPEVQPLTPVEERISALTGAQVGAVTVGQAEPPQDSDDDDSDGSGLHGSLSLRVGREDKEAEDTSLDIMEDPAASENTASSFMAEGMVGEMKVDDAPGPSCLQQYHGGRESRGPAPQRVSACLNDAQQHSDDEPKLEDVARQSLRMHSDLLGALSRVPESIYTLAVRMKEFTSTVAQASQQPIEPILGRYQWMLDASRCEMDSRGSASCYTSCPISINGKKNREEVYNERPICCHLFYALVVVKSSIWCFNDRETNKINITDLQRSARVKDIHT
uniref:uncharacterized protein n=1 Tax=Pristiophorus japonicus TaxID=55135 RepID=UPI00398F737F